MNGVIYCRVSSKEQVEGTSLESQQVACEEYARTKNIKVLKTFVEQGESAKFADRTQLLELIEFCREKKGQVQVLLVWKIDRFARNVADHFNVKATLTKYGVSIVSVTEPIDTKPEGKLMETILAGFAQFDNDVRAMRTVQGMRRKIQEGIFPWKPPLGYKSVREGREKKTRPDQPEQPLFGLLQKAWQEFATGAHSKAEIRRLLDRWGVMTHRGRPLSNQSIDNLFRNAYYAGILLDPWSGEEHQGLHVPMVSRGDFALVQQVVGRRNRSIPHAKHRDDFPLRGFVRCTDCQHYLTGSFSRGRSRRYPYYHCYNKTCAARGKGLPVEKVDEEFKAFLPVIAQEAKLLGKLGELIAKTAEQQEAMMRSKRARTHAILNRLDMELKELIRMRAQNLITDEEFQVHRSILLKRRHSAEAVPKEDRFEPDEIRQRLSEITEPLHELLATWTAFPPSYRSRFQRLVLPLGFTAGTIRTAERGVLISAIGNFADTESTVVPLKSKHWNQIAQEIKDFSDVLRAYHESKEGSRKTA